MWMLIYNWKYDEFQILAPYQKWMFGLPEDRIVKKAISYEALALYFNALSQDERNELAKKHSPR